MAQNFKETAHLNTNLKNLHDNWDLIKWNNKEEEMNAMDNVTILSDNEHEEMIKKMEILEAQLKEANEVIGFYGDMNNWSESFRGADIVEMNALDNDSSFYLGICWGGKRAREYQAKYV